MALASRLCLVMQAVQTTMLGRTCKRLSLRDIQLNDLQSVSELQAARERDYAGANNNLPCCGTYPAVMASKLRLGRPGAVWRRMHRGDGPQLSALSMRKETNAICETTASSLAFPTQCCLVSSHAG